MFTNEESACIRYLPPPGLSEFSGYLYKKWFNISLYIILVFTVPLLHAFFMLKLTTHFINKDFLYIIYLKCGGKMTQITCKRDLCQ